MSSIQAASGMQNAQAMFDLAAGRATQAAGGLTDPAAPGDPAAASPPDLAEAMVSMMTAQLAYTANARVLEMTLEHERSVLDLLA